MNNLEEEKVASQNPTVFKDAASPVIFKFSEERKYKPLADIPKAKKSGKEMIGDYWVGRILGTGSFG